MYYAAKAATKLPKDEDLAFCYDMLNKVSRRCARCHASASAPAAGANLTPRPMPVCRSFAVVIQQLPPSLRDAICVFYLVLRGLDTVEDDMAIAKKVKVLALLSFHEKIYIK